MVLFLKLLQNGLDVCISCPKDCSTIPRGLAQFAVGYARPEHDMSVRRKRIKIYPHPHCIYPRLFPLSNVVLDNQKSLDVIDPFPSLKFKTFQSGNQK